MGYPASNHYGDIKDTFNFRGTHWQISLSRRLLAFYTWINSVTECLYGAQCRSRGTGEWLKGLFCGHVRSCPPHWPQYMDSWLARFCILVNACHRKYFGSHFTPVKTFDRHTDFYTYQCMKCNRWQVFSFKFHENSEKKNPIKFHRSSRLLNIYWKLLKNLLM